MVSSRASSSPMPQPASRHSIKPFSIQPVIANIRRAAGFGSQDVRRRGDECHIRHSAVSTSRFRLAIWDGCSSNVCYDGYSYRTRVQLEGYGKSHSGTSCAARPLTPSPRAGRLFAACRATVLCDGWRAGVGVLRVRSSFFAGVRGVSYATSDNRRGTAG